MKTAILLAIAAMAIPCTATAADYPHRTALISRSNSAGVGHASVALLQRTSGPGGSTVGAKLIGRWVNGASPISTAGAYTTTQRGSDIRYSGKNGWHMVVRGDGTAAEYRNDAVRLAHQQASPQGTPTLAQLSSWGRAFIAQNLADTITLGRNEALVELRALYQEHGGSPMDGSSPAVSEITGAIVVFSRTIDGIDVVGDGSKVAIFYAADGTPWGFNYDWSSYVKIGTQQQTLSITEIRKRSSAFPASTSGAGPLGQATILEHHFECGYFDPGVRKRDPSAPVQTGCSWQRTQKIVADSIRNQADKNDGMMTSATTDVIPTGTKVEVDRKWPRAYFEATGQLLASPANAGQANQ